jgi:hypothetical protein
MMPWTIIIADFLEQGKHWDLKEVATVLRNAQAEIDRLKKDWQGLTDEERYLNEGRTSEEIEYARAIEAKLKEKNNE